MNERSAIVAFLRGEETRFAGAGADEALSDAARLRCRAKASVLCTVAAYVERGDHMPVERTPEVVLRAMLRAYEAAALDRAIAWAPTYVLDTWGSPSIAEMASCVGQIRLALAFAIVGRSPTDMLSVVIARDYEARLQGDRPLDAPPAEV